MNFNNIRYFISAAEYKNFTQVAKMNFVSPSAISLQISSMENELGFQLFDRSKKGVDLTPAGEYFYKECLELIRSYDRSVQNAAEISQTNKEILRVGITGYGVSMFLPQLGTELIRRHPEATIRLERDSLKGLKEKLLNDIVDVTFNFAFDVEGDPNIEVETLGIFEVNLLVSKQHRFAERTSIRGIEVENEKIIMVSKNYGAENLEHMRQQRRLEGYEPTLELVDSVDLLQMYVEMNQGVAFIPEKIFNYNQQTCKMIKISDGIDSIPYVICKKKEKQHNALSESFIDITKKYFSEY